MNEMDYKEWQDSRVGEANAAALREREEAVQKVREQKRLWREELRGWIIAVTAVLALLLSIFSIIWQMPLHA